MVQQGLLLAGQRKKNPGMVPGKDDVLKGRKRRHVLEGLQESNLFGWLKRKFIEMVQLGDLFGWFNG